MELLIFVKQYANEGHWLDTEHERQTVKIEARTDLDAGQIMKAKQLLDNKYHARPQHGDIIEKRDDGWWDSVVMKNPQSRMVQCYACVKIPGVTGMDYLADRYDPTDPMKMQRRNKVIGTFSPGEVKTETPQAVRIYDKKNDRDVVIMAAAGG